MVITLTASQIPEPLNVISRLHPKKLVKAMELQLSRNVQLHIRIVGARDANHFLIRVRHRFRSSASFTRSVCNAEFLQTILDLVLQLVDLVVLQTKLRRDFLRAPMDSEHQATIGSTRFVQMSSTATRLHATIASAAL